MMNGRNNGKKLLAVRILNHALEIVGVLPPVLADNAPNSLDSHYDGPEPDTGYC